MRYFEFPAVFKVKKREEIRVGKAPELFFCETGKSRVTQLSESASESGNCDLNRPDLCRQDVDSYRFDDAGTI